MIYPIFYSFIARDIATTKPFSVIKAACDLARKLDAELSVTVAALQISVPNILASKTVDGIIADEHKRSLASATAARDEIAEYTRTSKQTIHTEILKGDFDSIKKSFINRAKIHGLLFAEAGTPGAFLEAGLIEPLLFESGRPILIVPNRFSSDISVDRIMIAWDGSVGAARAVWSAILLLRLAKTIEIVTVTGEKELNDVPAASLLAAKLSYLGNKINVTALPYSGNTAAGLIQKHALKTHAGLIVQGAYGRSRWSEFILGGVTREMLHECPLPILMCH
jgi:nucleotide-binding universal stress UspA family protein